MGEGRVGDEEREVPVAERQVGGRVHGMDTGRPTRRLDADRPNARVRVGRARETAVERALLEVVGVEAPTAQQALVLAAEHPLAEPSGAHTPPSPPAGDISAAALLTARRIEAYPVQRQRLPAMPSVISSSLGHGLSASRPMTAIRKPGVQNPHCSPWHSWNARCTGCRAAPSGARPSTVVTSWPSACTASGRQERTGLPSKSTVQQPQTPCSHPTWVPV